MISIEKWMILKPLQKLPSNVGHLDKIIVATGFEWLPKVQKTPNLVTLPGYQFLVDEIAGVLTLGQLPISAILLFF